MTSQAASPAPSFDARSFRNALGTFATGVTIVTTRDSAGNDVGLTANSFNSVSLDPPMVLWSLAKSSLSRQAFMESDYFAVHILAADQQAVSDLFAKRGADKFSGLTYSRGQGGVPLLDGCAARFQCKTNYRYEGGDHEIIVGQVIEFEHFDRPSLAFQAGKYAITLPKPPFRPERENIAEGSFSRDALSYLVANVHFLLDQQSRPTIEAHALNRQQFYALSLLGIEAPRTTASLRETIAITGEHLSDTDIEELLRRNLVSQANTEDSSEFTLTDAGRTVLVETLAAVKAAESEAQQYLEFNEMQVLRSLLKRLIRGMICNLKKKGDEQV